MNHHQAPLHLNLFICKWAIIITILNSHAFAHITGPRRSWALTLGLYTVHCSLSLILSLSIIAWENNKWQIHISGQVYKIIHEYLTLRVILSNIDARQSVVLLSFSAIRQRTAFRIQSERFAFNDHSDIVVRIDSYNLSCLPQKLRKTIVERIEQQKFKNRICDTWDIWWLRIDLMQIFKWLANVTAIKQNNLKRIW